VPKSSASRKELIQDLILVTLIFCLVVILSATGVLQYVDWKIFDLMINLHRSTPVHRDNVVFVCIDQKSLEFFDRETGNGWPWPRDFYGRIVWHLVDCGAKAVVFDVIYSENDIDRTYITGEESDNEFAAAIDGSGVTYLAVVGEETSISDNIIHDIPLFLDDHGEIYDMLPGLTVYKSAVFPLKKFMDGARGLGLVNPMPEADGIHRRYTLVSKLDDRYVQSLAYVVAKDVMEEKAFRERILRHFGGNSVIDDEGKLTINWYGKGGTGRGLEGDDAVFQYYSFAAVMGSALDIEKGEEPIVPKEAFRDKIVIIGSNAPGLFDLKATPFTHRNLYPGMEIHATVIENLLAGDFIPRVPSWVIFLVMAVITALMFAFHRTVRNLRAFIVLFVILVAAEAAAGYGVFALKSSLLDTAELFGTTIFVFAGLVITGYFHETKEKRVLRGHFGRYVNETVMNEILENPNTVDFKGRTIHATVMATDIQGFTSISEKLQAHEVVARLNDYLSEVSELLIDNGAYINKYIGDAILALYGAFEEPDHMKKACYAAVYAQKIISKRNEQAELSGDIPFITRMGVTTGEMTMGNIGSRRKIEYTVIGDTVNTAFRMEGLNKYYRTRILVGEVTKQGAGDGFEFRLLDVLRVKGKETPEKVYELMGVAGDVDPERLRRRDEFENALTLYREQRFTEAREIFTRLAAEGDGTSEMFLERCEIFIAEPPPSDWDGVWTMTSK